MYHFLHSLDQQYPGRGERGVDMILCPEWCKCYENSGEISPIKTACDMEEDDGRRHIEVKLCLKLTLKKGWRI